MPRLHHLPAAFLLLTACGGDSESLPDARTGGPSVDSAGPGIDGAGPGVVRLTVTPPTAGVPVVFLDADEVEVATVMTDAAGQAQATMAAGGSVTVVAVDSGPPAGLPSASLVTFLAVEPGDELTLPGPRRGGVAHQVTVPTLAGASLYEVLTSCDTGATVAAPTLTMTLPCVGPATFLVRAHVGTTFQSFLAAVDVPATAAPIAVTGTYRPQAAVDVAVRGLPSSVTLAEVRANRVTAGLVVAGGVVGAAPSAGVVTTPDVPVDDLPGIDVGITALLSRPSSGPVRELQALYDRRAFVDAIELDAGPTLLPWIAGAAIDVKISQLAWLAQGGGGDGADLVLVVAQLIGRTTGVRRWVVIGPGGGTSLPLPRLPAPYAGLGVAPDDTTSVETMVMLGSPRTYAELRPVAATIIGAGPLSLVGPGEQLAASIRTNVD